VFIVWRNKRAEDEERRPDGIVGCEKQRNGEFEGKLGFWFDLDSQQYLENEVDRPNRYNLKVAMQQPLLQP
jgi:twinkle protein